MKSTKPCAYALSIAVASILAAAPQPVYAADQTRATLDEVIVTARKREESLQDTPVSITALSGETLYEQGVVDLKGIANSTPNMEFSYGGNGSGGGNFAQIFLRGVGQPDFIITKDPGVGVYVDGVYLARAPGSVLELLDVERIEVLRGPQGTLYGKNTIGGAVNVVTKQPQGESSGVAEITLGSFKRRDVSASVEFPIVDDKLAVRISAMSRSQDGFYRRLDYYEGPSNQFGADKSKTHGNDTNRQSGRINLLFTPTENLEFALAADVTKERQEPIEYQLIGVPTPAGVPAGATLANNIELYSRLFAPRLGVRPYGPSYIPAEPWTTYSSWPGYNNSDIWGTSLTIKWDVGAFDIKSITAYRELDVQTKGDADATPFDIVASGGIEIAQHQFSEELQFSGTALSERLNWVGGLWYFEETATDIQRSRQLAGLFELLSTLPFQSVAPGNRGPGSASPIVCPASTCLGGGITNTNDRAIARSSRTGTRLMENTSYAGFAQASFDITDMFETTVGLRYSKESKDFTYAEIYPTLPLPYTDPGTNRAFDNPSFPQTTMSDSWTVFTPLVSFGINWSDDVLTYLQWSKGFKAGGFNGRPSPATGLAPFGPEEIWTAELGLKSDWFDNRLRANAAVYFSDYTEIQITRLSPTVANTRVEENAGDGEIRGAELELSAVPVEGLNISAAVGYNDFKYKTLKSGVQLTCSVGNVDFSNCTLPFNPKFTAAVGASYTFGLGELGELSLRADAKHSDDYFVDPDNTVIIAQEAYTSLDARITLKLNDGDSDVFVGGSNLTNEAVVANGVNSVQNSSQLVTYKPPRQWYAGVRVNF